MISIIFSFYCQFSSYLDYSKFPSCLPIFSLYNFFSVAKITFPKMQTISFMHSFHQKCWSISPTNTEMGICVCSYWYKGNILVLCCVKGLILGREPMLPVSSSWVEAKVSCLRTRPTGLANRTAIRKTAYVWTLASITWCPLNPTIMGLSKTLKSVSTVGYEVERNTKFLGMGIKVCLLVPKQCRRVVKFCLFKKKQNGVFQFNKAVAYALLLWSIPRRI